MNETTGNNLTGKLSGGGTMTGSVGAVYGKDGKSAYEIACAHGFEGTEAEWIASLQGPQGEPGVNPEGAILYTEQQLTGAQKVQARVNIAAAGHIVCDSTGNVITLDDAANAPLMGLRIFGYDRMDNNGEVHIVGDKGSVTVNVAGKNIADLRKFSTKPIRTATTTASKDDAGYGTTLTATTGNSVTVTQSKWPNTTMLYHSSNGFVFLGFYCPLRVGNWVTISLDYEITKNPLNVVGTDLALQLNTGYQSNASVKNNRIYLNAYINEKTASTADGWNYLNFAIAGTSGVISNFQAAYGRDAVDYEPCKEPQTITIPTPSGLVGGSGVYDEIDFAKGVLIQRVREQSETPLPEDVLEAYAKLHTYKPNTNIINDEDAEMSVEYVADTKNFILNEIGKKFNELATAIVNNA